MKKLLYIILAFALLCSCRERYEDNWPELMLDFKKMTLAYTDTKVPIYIYCNGAWTARVTEGADWMALDDATGSGVSVTHLRFSQNLAFSRAGVLEVTSDGVTKKIDITQSGRITEPKISFEKTEHSLYADKTDITISFASNLPLETTVSMVPDVEYPTGADSWISSIEMLNKEDSLFSETMPDGMRRYMTVNFNENISGAERSAIITLWFQDAAGKKYSSATKLVHTADKAYFTIPDEDRVNKSGGERIIPVTTNLGEDIANATITINYGAVSGYISDERVTKDAKLIFNVEENTGTEPRTAEMIVKYDNLADTLYVTQKAQVSSYGKFAITSNYDFLDWISDYDVWQPTDTISLEIDVDITGQNIVPGNFTGLFDGKGHVIKGLSVSREGNAGFFSSLSGTLKNVKFGTETEHCTIKSVAKSSASAAGLVAELTGKGSIDNVTSYCDVYGSGSTVQNLGGIVGKSTSTGTVSNCVNYGNVVFEAASCASSVNHGGIIGCSSDALTVTGCDNRGSVKIASSMSSAGSTYRMGGLVGMSTGNGIKIEDCNNYGAITDEASGVSEKMNVLGGILAFNSSTTAEAVSITGCTNHGDITYKPTSANGMVVIGGLLGYNYYSGSLSLAVIGSETKPCANLGKISDLSARIKSAKVMIGGLVGFTDNSLKLSYCTNGESGTEKGMVFKKETGTNTSHTVISGLVSWIVGCTEYASQKCDIDHCTNYATVTNEGDVYAQYLYLSAVVGGNEPIKISSTEYFFNVNVTNTSNYGKIANRAVGSEQIRMGGFVGDLAGNITISNSLNAGEISSISPSYKAGVQTRVSGFIGSNTKGNGFKITNCTNSGDVIYENTSSSVTLTSAEIGGIAGYVGKASTTDGCKSNCNVSASGNITNVYAGGLVGWYNIAGTLKNSGVAGTVNETDITSENYSSFLIGSVKSGITVTKSGNYFITE